MVGKSRVFRVFINQFKNLKIFIIRAPASFRCLVPGSIVQAPEVEYAMLEQLTGRLETLSSALQLRAARQQVIASNIANVDSPGYVARDIDFNAAMTNAMQAKTVPGLAQTSSGHLAITSTEGLIGSPMAYTVQTQPSLDGNSVDLDQQRANFADNAIRYESTLRFVNSHVKTMLSAITGQ